MDLMAAEAEELLEAALHHPSRHEVAAAYLEGLGQINFRAGNRGARSRSYSPGTRSHTSYKKRRAPVEVGGTGYMFGAGLYSTRALCRPRTPWCRSGRPRACQHSVSPAKASLMCVRGEWGASGARHPPRAPVVAQHSPARCVRASRAGRLIGVRSGEGVAVQLQVAECTHGRPHLFGLLAARVDHGLQPDSLLSVFRKKGHGELCV